MFISKLDKIKLNGIKALAYGCGVVLLLYAFEGRSQTIQNDKDFFLEKLKTNYPGYAEKINGKQFARFLQTLESENIRDTFRLLSLIALYFKDSHLLVLDPYYVKHLDSGQNRQHATDNEVYFNTKSIQKKKYEGYWTNDYRNCVMVIRQVSSKPYILKGYVVESRKNVLPQGAVVCGLEQEKGGGFITDFADPLWGGRFYVRSRFVNDSVLITGGYGKWEKLPAYKAPLLAGLPAFSTRASGKSLDKDNFLLTIPENSSINTRIVDSIVKSNDEILRTTKNLVIDIRNNIGGSTRTYAPLLPYIYTGPIVKLSGYTYQNKEMIEQQQASLENRRKSGDSARARKAARELKELIESKTGFILSPGDTVRYDSVMPFPRHVALLVNYGCMSAAEMMIMDFRQSKKVTVFGQRTAGAIDYLDFYPVDMPSKKYTIYIPGSKRVIPPGGKKYDGVGLDPDIPISDTVPDWIDFIKLFYGQGS